MVLYDSNKKLIAISDKTLELLGFESLEEFKKSVYDIAQLFAKRAGYIHEFKSFHWIDYCLTNSTVTHRAILHTKDGKEFEVFINISPLNGIETKSFYLVTLEPNTFSECYTPAQSTPAAATATQQPLQPAPQEISIEPKEFPKPNLAQISEELNLGEDIVLDFIQEYVKHAAEKLDEVNKAIKSKDIKKIKNIIHTLRGVSANLRLKPAVEILSRSSETQKLEELVKILEEYYSYIAFLAKTLDIPLNKELKLTLPASAPATRPQQPKQPQTQPEHAAAQQQEQPVEPEKLQEATKELGLSFEEYQNYLKELINEIKINLAYNNYTELHKLASFARNLYLQECARYLDEVSVNQNPELVKKCLRDLEELKKEPNPFLITPQDLKDSLEIVQIDKEDFIDILEDLVIELKALRSVKMRKEKFLKKAKQLKSLAESMRLSNLVLLLNTIISNYPLDKHLAQQFEEAIRSLEKSIKEI